MIAVTGQAKYSYCYYYYYYYLDPDYLKFLESLEADKNKANESKESGTDVGGTQLERLENRLALVTGKR